MFDETGDDQYKVALLIKTSALKKAPMEKHYVEPLVKSGIAASDIIGFSLSYNEHGKCPAKQAKEYLENMLKALDSIGTKVLFVADSAYFKFLTKEKKADPHYGYVKPCAIKGYEHIDVVIGTNYQQLFYNPDIQSKLDLSLGTLANHLAGTHVDVGTGIIHSAQYPSELNGIALALQSLYQYDALTCDVETFDLKHYKAGLGTIAFAWDQHNGIAFNVDYVPLSNPVDGVYGKRSYNKAVRLLLLEFFTNYKGKLIYHNASFDIKILIYAIFMDDLLDQDGLLNGLHTMYQSVDDTKIISYLATNSCAGNKLSLKEQGQEFAGNYAQDDIHDITLIEGTNLLEYNLVDCLTTWYVYNKNQPIMVADDQQGIYDTIMLPSLKIITQMELTGLCLDMDQVLAAELELTTKVNGLLSKISSFKVITELILGLRKEKHIKDFEDRKAKAKNPENIKEKDFDVIVVEFNPNSNPQIQHLLYECMQLPVLDLTDTKQPATGAKTLKKLLNHTDSLEYKEIIQALYDYSKIAKILSSFIPAFKEAPLAKDGKHYLFGNFNLGGTVSGRLSSSKVNLQQLPSGSIYGKLIKKCFIAPDGYLFSGADFNALEDVINTLLTRDPNKEKVLIEGFDGHCFRTYYYWKDKFPHVNPADPKSVNSIKKTNDDDRSLSKPVSFALQYAGTWHTLVSNCGFSPVEAKAIEGNYHTLYQVSDKWVRDKVVQASKDGFSTTAFGLRIRTPLLSQVILNTASTPYEAQAEARTLGNAISGQSYGLVNNRAAIEFMKRVWESPYVNDIKLTALIHDAIYLFVKNELGVIKWVNDNLIECMRWQDLPELKHDKINLGAELDIYYPNWANTYTLPNNSTIKDIYDICTG